MPLRARAPAPALASAQMWGVRELRAVPARAARGASKPEGGRRTDLVASFPSGRLLTKRDVPSPRSGAVPARRPRTFLCGLALGYGGYRIFMSVINRRNAIVGWAVWKIASRAGRKK